MIREHKLAQSILRKHGVLILIGFIYLYSFPYFPKIHSANELPRIYLTMAMVDDGAFSIGRGIKRWGPTEDISEANGHSYSNKAPGSSILAMPAYVLLKAITGGKPTLAQCMWTFRVATGVLPTMIFLLFFCRFLRPFTNNEPTLRLCIMGYALGTMAMPYSLLFFSHQLAAICIAASFMVIVRVIEGHLQYRWLLLAGFFAGCGPLCDYQSAFSAIPFSIYFIWKLRSPRQWIGILYAILGVIPPVALLFFYHWRAFGSPFLTGYHVSRSFAHYHQTGFLVMTAPTWQAFAGSTFAADNGLFFLCPMLLLAIPGWVLLAREKRWWLLWITLSTVVINLLFISSISFWRGGWQLGPRYITALLPFAMIPVAVAMTAMDRRWYLRGTSVAAVLLSIMVYSLSCAEFPYFPDTFRNPLFEVTFRLIREGHAPYNAGWLLGLRGLSSLVPYLVLLGAVLSWIFLPSTKHWRSAVLGVCLAVSVLWGYSLIRGAGAPGEEVYQSAVKGSMPK